MYRSKVSAAMMNHLKYEYPNSKIKVVNIFNRNGNDLNNYFDYVESKLIGSIIFSVEKELFQKYHIICIYYEDEIFNQSLSILDEAKQDYSVSTLTRMTAQALAAFGEEAEVSINLI